MSTKIVKVKSVKYIEHNNMVCDITVEDNHNLFVCSEISKKPILVHNCLEENMKVLNTVTGKGYYSLANLTMQYGSDIYYRIEFGKSKRTTIESAPLSEGLIQYGCLDVVVPLMIHEKQIQRAKDIGYTKFKSMVRHQTSDMLHTFSTLEYNGVHTDIDYLFSLKTPESPILKEMNRIKTDLQQSKGVVKANAILTTKSGAPKIGLFGAKTRHVFDIAKKEHQELLFFKVLKLEPVSYGKSKKPKVDKEFQNAYSDRKEVALFTELTKVKKLFNAYVKSFIKQWGQDDDMRYDSCIRPHFSFLDVVTGRTSAKKPSLHQIPARSELGKHIKRLFITKPGRLLLKVDYSAHEVRGWSLISRDKLVADVFDVGIQLRNRFKLLPTAELAKRIELEGDVHKINAAYFFGLPIEKVDKSIRNAVKAVIFGLIYQQGIKGLAKNTKQTVEAITKLVKQFKQRFPKGVQWFDDVQSFAKKNLYVESPLGRRRHLWGLLIPKDAQNAEACTAAMLRRAVNSPVQGMGSDFMMTGAREIEKLKWKHYKDTGHYPDFKLCNSVHDSLEIDCAYEDFWTAIKYVEQGLTTCVAERAKERNDFDFVVPLEIDFEIGPTGKDVQGWNRDYKALYEILTDTLKIQRDELGHDLNIKKVRTSILEDQYDQMPHWMKKQLWATKVNIKGMDRNPLKEKDLRIIKKNRKESKEAA
jgi:DNA polymerase I-like protein with 3'-5' exonuclease and polymerase domains